MNGTIMLDAILEKRVKFALFAVRNAYVEFPEDEDFKHQLSDGTWLLTKIPMGIDTGWREWIGSLRYESLSNSNLILVNSEGTSNPEILDGQHLEIERKVSLLFHILQLSGVLEYSEANLVVGSYYNAQSDVRRMSRMPQFLPTRGYIPRPINIDLMETAVRLQSGFEQIESNGDAFPRVKKGFKVLMDGLKEKNGEDRIHEFVRSLEALILPDIGKTRRQFVHRCQTVAKASPKAKQILEESFDLRSMAEHLNNWENALESYSPDVREETALLRTRQMERLACFSYTCLLEHQSIRSHYISEKDMKDFWGLPDNQRKQRWGHQCDLEQIG
jgi:hypothetical protein